MVETPIAVLLADDDVGMLANYRRLIDSEPDLAVVGAATNGLEAYHLAVQLTPDVVLMDLNMPTMNGVEATRRITESGISSRVLVLTVFDQAEDVEAAIRAGAAGFILKNGPLDDLLRAIRIVSSGGGMLSPEITDGVIERLRTAGDDAVVAAAVADPMVATSRGSIVHLTARELDVLQLVAAGRSNGEIAGKLFLAESSVSTYVSRLRAKLDARSRAELVALYYESRQRRQEPKSAKVSTFKDYP